MEDDDSSAVSSGGFANSQPTYPSPLPHVQALLPAGGQVGALPTALGASCPPESQPQSA